MKARILGIALMAASFVPLARADDAVNALPPAPAEPPYAPYPPPVPAEPPYAPPAYTYPTPSDVPVNALPQVNAPRTPVVPYVDRAMTSGLGVGTGLGSDNVWFGAHLIYYAQLPNPRARFALHTGVGLLPWRDPDVRWGVRGGGFFSYGVRHRFLVGAVGGTMDWQTFGLHGRALESRPEYGMAFEVGYELMTPHGFYLRTTIGPGVAYSRETPLREREAHLIWRGNLVSLGYKLW